MSPTIRDLLERAEASLLDYKSDAPFGAYDRDLLNDIRTTLAAAPAPAVMFNGLTGAETAASASVAGLSAHAQAVPITGRSSTACDDQDAPEPCRYPSCQFIGCPPAGCYDETEAEPQQ